ncbi:hypothetical protein [Caulobacter sp. 1776]|uniref:hypothetical protein n=1 Tax=Caulobacter sp. 1776 TaxID=3156420 RepID=UPI003395219F
MRTRHLDKLSAFLKPDGEIDPKRKAELVEAFQTLGAKETSPSLLLYLPTHRRLHARVTAHLKL